MYLSAFATSLELFCVCSRSFCRTMECEYQVITSPVLALYVTSTLSEFESERRYQKDLTISELKNKLQLVTGASLNMKLEVYNKENTLVCTLDNDSALLGSYPIDDNMRIHVVDTARRMGEFEDVSKVQKFELTEEEYAKKTDSVRAFKQRMKMGRFREEDPEEKAHKEAELMQKEAEEAEKARSISVDDRCEVNVVGQPTRRGCVKYVGETEFKPGHWVGVQYDEPLGKHDGTVQGKRYFQCPPKYGGFVRPSQVTVGDFPELGFDDDDMDEM